MKAPVPDPVQQAIGWVQVFREDWQESRADPDYAPQKARAFLAAWGALRRLVAPSEFPSELADFPDLLRRDAPALLEALRDGLDPSAWVERAGDLDAAWDGATTREGMRELEFAAVDLFDKLDRDILAISVARELANGTNAAIDWLAERQRQLAAAEDFFADHIDAFLPVAPLASAILNSCRSDLDEAEPDLWRTLRKHRALEEAWEEAQAEPELQRLNDRDRLAIQIAAGTTRSRLAPARLLRFRRGPALAADVASVSVSINVFTWQSPDNCYRAFLTLRQPPLPHVALAILTTADEPAAYLAGTSVVLANVSSVLDSQGQARFLVDDLPSELSAEKALSVGGERWVLLPEEVV